MSENSRTSWISILLEEHLTWKNFKRLGFWVLVFVSLKWIVGGVLDKLVYQSEREARGILAMAKWKTLQAIRDECEIMLDRNGFASLSDQCVEALSEELPPEWYRPYTEDLPFTPNDAGFFSHFLNDLLSPRSSGFAQQVSIFYTFITGAAMLILWKVTLAPSARPARYRRWFPRHLSPWLPWIPFVSLGLFMSLFITFLLRLYLLIPMIWLLLEDLVGWTNEVVWQSEAPEWRKPVALLD